ERRRDGGRDGLPPEARARVQRPVGPAIRNRQDAKAPRTILVALAFSFQPARERVFISCTELTTRSRPRAVAALRRPRPYLCARTFAGFPTTSTFVSGSA